MPAGHGGQFGDNYGGYVGSKVASHKHTWGGPEDKKGYPSSSKDTSEGTAANQSYWRGNKNGSTSTYGRPTTSYGHDITAPPVYIGVYIMKVG